MLTEAGFLLQALRGGSAAVLELVSRGALLISFSLGEEATAAARLLPRYRNVPMTLADACLVRMSERLAACVVATLDGDFAIYRRHGAADRSHDHARRSAGSKRMTGMATN